MNIRNSTYFPESIYIYIYIYIYTLRNVCTIPYINDTFQYTLFPTF